MFKSLISNDPLINYTMLIGLLFFMGIAGQYVIESYKDIQMAKMGYEQKVDGFKVIWIKKETK